MSEIVKAEKHELITQEDFDFIVKFDEYKKRYNVIENKIKQAGEAFLDSQQTDSYTQKQDGTTIRLYKKKPYTKKQVDTKALKEQGLYEDFTKDVWVKGSVVIQVEYED